MLARSQQQASWDNEQAYGLYSAASPLPLPPQFTPPPHHSTHFQLPPPPLDRSPQSSPAALMHVQAKDGKWTTGVVQPPFGRDVWVNWPPWGQLVSNAIKGTSV